MLPLIAPGVLFGALLAFATSLEEVVVVLIVGGPAQRTLPREMFVQLREHISPTLATAAALLMLISAVLLLAVEILRRRAERLRIFEKAKSCMSALAHSGPLPSPRDWPWSRPAARHARVTSPLVE